jgi:outer membrane lipoprotein-sorting protein
MKSLKFYMLIFFGLASHFAFAQDANSLLQKVKDKLNKVNDYEASGIMKTNVNFLKVPEAAVTVYFKKPDNLKIKNDKGISLVPKGALSISLNNLLKGDFTAIDAGTEMMQQVKVKIIKLLPVDENADIVLSTLYIDESKLLIIKAKTTTKENGTYEVEMSYGKYESYALPDKVLFTFNTKDYKLPKGVTFDYDDGSKKKTENPISNNKGRVEINYSSYLINKGLPDAVFK